MLNIVARNSVFWITHLLTFSAMGLYAMFAARPGFALVMPLFLPIWVSSSVLSSENRESWRFLRTLPVTDRQVVRLKFGLALLAMLGYASILAVVGRFCLGSGGDLVLQLKVAALCVAGSLLLAAACYIGVWGVGSTAMTAVVIVLVAVNFLAVIAVGGGLRESLGPAGGQFALIRLLDAAPLAVCGLGLVVALAAFWGLLELGVRVRTSSEAHL